MTDRVRHLTVLLREDMRVDDAEAVVSAIRQLRAVSEVKLGPPPDDQARWEARHDLRHQLRDFMRRLLLDDLEDG